MANSHVINSTAINATPAIAGIPDVSDSQGTPYRLESHQQDGTLLNFLPNRWGASWHQAVNQPDTLTFSYDGTDSRAADFVFPNEVWLYQGDNTTVQQKFIVSNTDELEDVGYTIQVTCKSLLWQTAKELVTFNEQTAISIKNTVATWLNNFQTQTPNINLGGFDTAIGGELRSTTTENKTILGAVNDLQKTIGGFFSVDTNRRLNWRRSIGEDVSHIINIKKNCSFIKKSIDYTNLATRVVAYGRGESNIARLKVTVNDATAQSAWGIVTGILNDQTVNNIADLTSAANAELQRKKTPLTTYDIGVIDLSQTSLLDYTFEASALALGTQLNLIGNDSGIDIYTRVLTVTKDLDNPLNVRISVGDELAGTSAWGKVGDTTGQTPEDQSLTEILSGVISRTDRQESDTGVFDDLLAQVAGGTLATPATSPLGPLVDPTCLSSWCPTTDVGNLTTHIVDIIENNTNTTTQADVEDAIVTAVNDVITAAGASPHDSAIYNSYITNLESNGGIVWGGEVGAFPTLPTAKPTIVYHTTDDQLHIGYNGSGSADQWTPMQKTTSLSGGTPT